MILTGDSSTVDLGCPSTPMAVSIVGVQAAETTESGYEHVEDYVTVRYIRKYSFRKMPKTIYDDLETFFLYEARMRLNIFDVEDDFDNIYNGRFSEAKLDGVLTRGADSSSDAFFWTGTISIKDTDITSTNGGGGGQ